MDRDTEINFDAYLKETLVKVLEHIYQEDFFRDERRMRYHLERFEAQIRRQRIRDEMDSLNTKIDKAREEGDKQRELQLLKEWSDLIAKDMKTH